MVRENARTRTVDTFPGRGLPEEDRAIIFIYPNI